MDSAMLGSTIGCVAALDDERSDFDLARLRGRPFLLKFLRGHW